MWIYFIGKSRGVRACRGENLNNGINLLWIKYRWINCTNWTVYLYCTTINTPYIVHVVHRTHCTLCKLFSLQTYIYTVQCKQHCTIYTLYAVLADNHWFITSVILWLCSVQTVQAEQCKACTLYNYSFITSVIILSTPLNCSFILS